MRATVNEIVVLFPFQRRVLAQIGRPGDIGDHIRVHMAHQLSRHGFRPGSTRVNLFNEMAQGIGDSPDITLDQPLGCTAFATALTLDLFGDALVEPGSTEVAHVDFEFDLTWNATG